MLIKVLFFINSLREGGAERVLVNLVNNLNRDRFEITILTLFNKGPNRKYLEPNIKYASIFRRRIPGIKIMLKIFPPTLLYKYLIKSKNNDIVISYLQGITTRIIAGAPSHKIKIGWLHGKFDKLYHSKSYRSVREMYRLYRKFDAIVGVSKNVIDSFISEMGIYDKTFIIYNTHNVREIFNKSHEETSMKMSNETLNFISAGSFIKVKGYTRLIECVRRLKCQGYIFHLYLIGTGEQEEKLKKMVNSFQLNNYVTFLGFKENPYKYFRKADMYICSSYSEGFSGTVSEATILGIPTLTTDCSGMEEILGKNSKYGLIVNNTDQALCEGIKSILDDSQLLDHYKNIVKERQPFFATEQTVKQVEDLLISLIEKKQIENV